MATILDWMEILDTLSVKDKENLACFCQERSLSEWEVLFNEGDEANAMYILKTGAFEVSRIVDWEKVILWDVKAEEILGEMALFWDTWKRMAKAVCTKDSILITILSFSILELSRKNPDLLEKIKKIINDRMISNKMKEKE